VDLWSGGEDERWEVERMRGETWRERVSGGVLSRLLGGEVER
jgi:hypothetical protein